MLPQGELLFRDEQSGHVRLFEGEEPDFFRNAAGISRQAAVAAHDPVAGDDNADRIVPYGTAYGLRPTWFAFPAAVRFLPQYPYR